MPTVAAFLPRALLFPRPRPPPPPPLPPPLPTVVARRQFHHFPFPRLRLTKPRPLVIVASSSSYSSGASFDELDSVGRSDNLSSKESILLNMVQEIEPLDVSLIQKDVPANTVDAMKRTISGMLGLLPSDQFHVLVEALWEPLFKLLISSMKTGYTCVAGTRTTRYRAIPPKIDRRRSISIVGGRLREKKGRRRVKEEKTEKRSPYFPVPSSPARHRCPRVASARTPSPPAGRGRFLSRARRRNVSPPVEKG
ncbi:hypothetical protein B296_00054794 [Ensete ventricosum]|uniref:Uncharacterized protein n=1 Tax=Ensete ventricosum TaxID=4639 RepID=A0A426Y2K3_ENSVE|nr:hypothetical protein B296_00054794 [Ensete ventricosum]